MSKEATVFKKIGEGFAHVQSFIDDALQFTFKKIQISSEKNTNSKGKIHKKIISNFGKAIGDLGSGFYEKYRDLKKNSDNNAENFINSKIKDFDLRAVILKAKMSLLGIKKGDLESLKKLKDPRGENFDKKVALLLESGIENNNKKGKY